MHQYSSKKDWFIHKGAAHHFSYFGSQKNLVISHLPITKALRVHWEKKNIQHLISVRNWSFLLITAVYVTLASTYSTSNCNKGKMHHFLSHPWSVSCTVIYSILEVLTCLMGRSSWRNIGLEGLNSTTAVITRSNRLNFTWGMRWRAFLIASLNNLKSYSSICAAPTFRFNGKLALKLALGKLTYCILEEK